MMAPVNGFISVIWRPALSSQFLTSAPGHPWLLWQFGERMSRWELSFSVAVSILRELFIMLMLQVNHCVRCQLSKLWWLVLYMLCFWSISLLLCLQKQEKMVQLLGPLHSCGRLERSKIFMVLTWPHFLNRNRDIVSGKVFIKTYNRFFSQSCGQCLKHPLFLLCKTQ